MLKVIMQLFGQKLNKYHSSTFAKLVLCNFFLYPNSNYHKLSLVESFESTERL